MIIKKGGFNLPKLCPKTIINYCNNLRAPCGN